MPLRGAAHTFVVPARVAAAQWRTNEYMASYVYILASRKHGTLYIGVATDLARRIWEHREGIGSSFVKKYRVTRLVYMECFDDVDRAIQREKTMKEWPRAWKIRTVEKTNPEWRDLYEDINR